MASTSGRFIAFVWRTADGAVWKRRSYGTLGGAIRFAEQRSADAGILEVSITAPVDHDTDFGRRIGVARKGKYTHTDQETAIMASTSKTDADDNGEDVKQVKPAAAGKAKQTKVVERVTPGKAAKWEDVLAMSDVAITKLDPGTRPNPKTLDGAKLPSDPYSTAVINFMTGNRKHPAQACIWKLTSAEGMDRRNAVRKAIAKHVGVKPAQVRFDKPGKRTSDKLAPSAGGPAKKPTKPVAAPKPAAAPKPVAAKKPVAAAAAKKPSVTTRVSRAKKAS